jgi:prefoldin subunit 5
MGGQQDRVVKLERVAQSLASDSRTVAHATESQKSTLSELERRLRALRDLATSLDAAVSAVDRACPVVRDAVVEQQQGLARAGERVRQVASGAQASQSAVQAVAAEAAMLDQQAHHLMAAVSALDRTAG